MTDRTAAEAFREWQSAVEADEDAAALEDEVIALPAGGLEDLRAKVEVLAFHWGRFGGEVQDRAVAALRADLASLAG